MVVNDNYSSPLGDNYNSPPWGVRFLVWVVGSFWGLFWVGCWLLVYPRGGRRGLGPGGHPWDTPRVVVATSSWYPYVGFLP